MKKLLVLTLMMAFPALAAESPVQYSRTTVIVRPKAPVQASAANGIAFDTEMRDVAAATRTPGWYNFATYGDYRGAMVTFDTPSPVTIEASNDYSAIDVLMMDNYGTILQIAPSLVPAQMQEPIASVQPVSAVLYLKGGICAKLGIQPGDTVQHSMFRKKPVVLTAPVAPASASVPVSPAAAPSPLTPQPSTAPSVSPTPPPTQPTNTNAVSKSLPAAPNTPPLDENLVNQVLKRYGQ